MDYVSKDGGVVVCHQEFKNDATRRHLEVVGYRDVRGELSIPAEINGWPVTEIHEKAFDGCLMSTVSIPDSIKKIGSKAFANCKNLESIAIPSCVTHIEAGYFRGCPSLKRVRIPSSVESIESAFDDGLDVMIDVDEGNPKYKSMDGYLLTKNGELLRGRGGDVIIPEGVWAIADGAFEKLSGLKSVIITDAVRFIGERAFSDCSSLESVTICGSGGAMQYINDYAFENCARLKCVRFIDTAIEIASNAFDNCESLETVIVPPVTSDLHRLQYRNVFSKFRNVEIHAMPVESIVRKKRMEKSKISDFDGLARKWSEMHDDDNPLLVIEERSGRRLLVLPPGTKEMPENAFADAQWFDEIIWPEGLEKIGDHAFARCNLYHDLYLPEGLKEIGRGAFESCEVNGVCLPRTLKVIGERAFRNCRRLEDIHTEQGIALEQIDDEAFMCDARKMPDNNESKEFRNSTSSEEFDAEPLLDLGAEPLVDLDAEIPVHERMEQKLEERSSDKKTEVRIRGSVKHIGARAFKGCGVIRFEAQFPPESIGDGAFDGCAEDFVVPKTISEKLAEAVIEKYPEGFAVGAEHGEYMIIDISSGPASKRYPVEYIDEPPADGWGSEFITDRLVFRLIRPGCFLMGMDLSMYGRYGGDNTEHEVILTHPYYISVFPLTIGQWLNVMGGSLADEREYIACHWFEHSGDASEISDNELRRWTKDMPLCKEARKEIKGKEWPISAEVTPDCLVGVLRRKTGIGNIDFPTEAEWEFACKVAGYHRFSDNLRDKRGCQCYGEVGRWLPNGLGLYDIGTGNAWEYCIDKYARNKHKIVVNPIGGTDIARGNVAKGGGRYFGLGGSISNAENRGESNNYDVYDGESLSGSAIRLCITLS